VKPGFSKGGLERGRIPETVATVAYGSNVCFRNTSQLAQHWKLLIRTPCADTQAATLHQGAMHLSSGSSRIREKLKPLLAQNHIKPLAMQKWQCTGIAFPPINHRSYPPCDGQHVGIQVNANDRPKRCQALVGEPRNDSGAASDIDDAFA
jgi:hypothetical protein